MLVFEDDLSPASTISSSQAKRLSAAESDALVTRWLQSSLARRRLEEMCGLRDADRFGRSGSGFDLRSRALELLRRGELKVVPRMPRGGGGGGGGGGSAESAAAEQQTPAEPASSAPPAQKTWVEFQLVDADDRPVADVRYRVELPSGAVREGRTSRSGLIRFDDLDDGTCKLELPDLDRDAWETA